jgi:hypothetical protein
MREVKQPEDSYDDQWEARLNQLSVNAVLDL